MCRHTVEEIVLKRALAKLELTQTVIEGGQLGYRLSKLLPGCPTGGSGGGSKERVWWQVVWY